MRYAQCATVFYYQKRSKLQRLDGYGPEGADHDCALQNLLSSHPSTCIRAPTPLADGRFVRTCQHPWPGVAPGGAVSFLCVAKEKTPKERPPPLPAPSAALREPAVRALDGVWLNSLRSNNASPFPPKAVLLGASRGGPGNGIGPALPGIAPRARNGNGVLLPSYSGTSFVYCFFWSCYDP
jgi:hypothetical protein